VFVVKIDFLRARKARTKTKTTNMQTFTLVNDTNYQISIYPLHPPAGFFQMTAEEWPPHCDRRVAFIANKTIYPVPDKGFRLAINKQCVVSREGEVDTLK
jgi:hypothetical protein